NNDAPLLAESIDGSDLVVTASFSKMGSSRHYDNGFSDLESCNNRAHACMSDDKLGGVEMGAKLRWIEELRALDVLRSVVRATDLSKDIRSSPQTSPFVHCADQSIEGLRGTNGNKDH